jgi:membrane dipeptidase
LAAVLLVVAAAPARAAEDPALERALRVLQRAPVIDGHNDLPWAIRESKQAPKDVEAYDLRRTTRGQTDLSRLRAGRVGGQFWSVYIPGDVRAEGYVKVQLEQIDIARRVIARYPEALAPAATALETRRALREGKISWAWRAGTPSRTRWAPCARSSTWACAT